MTSVVRDSGRAEGNTWGDSAYGGTISWIQDLTTLANIEGSANAYSDNTITQSLIQTDASPFTVADANKLIVHSAGTRNPFGLCVDQYNSLWFTNNFNRTKTNGDGTSGFGYPKDSLGPDFSMDIQDQLFKAQKGADYGYADDNWRGIANMLNPATAGYHRVNSRTFDNLYKTSGYVIHDPTNPDGLGPSASADGCAFYYALGMPRELYGNVFITRWNTTITEAANGGTQHSLTYSDVVAVVPYSGMVRRVASGFNNPIALLADGAQRLLVADYSVPGNANGNGSIYALFAKWITGVTIAPATGGVGENVLLRALLRRRPDLKSVAGKTLTFSVDGNVAGTAITDANGLAHFRYLIPQSALPGSQVIRVDWAGDASYSASTQTAALTIKYRTGFNLANAIGTAGQTVVLRSHLRRRPDLHGLIGKTVTFKVAGSIVGTAVTNSIGMAILNYTIPLATTTGVKSLTVEWAGDGDSFPANQTGILTVN